MIYSKAGLHLTESFETLRLVAYPDVGGVWTIGWGHTFDVREGDTCTGLQALQWLLSDIKTAEHNVNVLVKVELTQAEFDALVDFAFNVGVEAFRDSTMLRFLNLSNYLGAANEFERWHYVKGKECAGLLRRREQEEALFRSAAAPSKT